MRYKSKFDWCNFYDNYNHVQIFAISKERYSLEKAVEIMKREVEFENYDIKTIYVKYGFYYDGDEVRNGWSAFYEKQNSSCECYAFITS